MNKHRQIYAWHKGSFLRRDRPEHLQLPPPGQQTGLSRCSFPSWQADGYLAESLNHPSAQGPTHYSAVCHTATATSCKSSNTRRVHGYQLSNMDAINRQADNLCLPSCGPQTCRGWVLLPPDKVLASTQCPFLLLGMCSAISMCLVSWFGSLTSRTQSGEEERNISLPF